MYIILCPRDWRNQGGAGAASQPWPARAGLDGDQETGMLPLLYTLQSTVCTPACHLQSPVGSQHSPCQHLSEPECRQQRMAMDLSIHNNNKDNNNHIRVVDLSLSKPLSEEAAEEVKTEDKLKSLLPQLDITALSILTLARLQVGIII